VALLGFEGNPPVALSDKFVNIGLDPPQTPASRVRGRLPIAMTISPPNAPPTAEFLASVVQYSNDAIITKDLNGRVTSWNSAAERIFGYTAAEMIGNSISILAAPDRIDEMPDILRRITQGERIEHYQTRRKTKAGLIVDISLTVSPMRDATGRIIGASKIARDITEQVRAADRLVELNAALLKSEAQARQARDWLETMLKGIGDAVIATDANGKITLLNAVAESLTGWRQEEAIGRLLDEVFVISNEESGAAAENPASKALREGRIVGLANHTRLTARDGRHIPIDDSAAPFRNADGTVMGVVLVFRDITARKKAEQAVEQSVGQLRETNAALARANADLNQFAFAASHDLQEPLRMITSYSQMLLKGYRGQLDSDAATWVQWITEGTKRMGDLLRDLLAYTEVTGTVEEPVEPVDLNLVFQQTVQNCKATIEETQASVTSDCLPVIPGCKPHFVQLFQNLIANALKYRSERPLHIHV
jgi:PAS domain S-box-containing protein